MKGLTPACRVKMNAAGDWQILPPAGQITQIGNAGATSSGLVANDDLFISGKIEVDGEAYYQGDVFFAFGVGLYVSDDILLVNEGASFHDLGTNDSLYRHKKRSEEVVIPIGQGAAGVNSGADLAQGDSIIEAVAFRVTQAPGGGATQFSIGRTGGNIDEFAQTLAVALGTTGTSAADGDGVNPGPVHNAADNTFVITTDVNVAGADMKIRICVWDRKITAPTG